MFSMRLLSPMLTIDGIIVLSGTVQLSGSEGSLPRKEEDMIDILISSTWLSPLRHICNPTHISELPRLRHEGSISVLIDAARPTHRTALVPVLPRVSPLTACPIRTAPSLPNVLGVKTYQPSLPLSLRVHTSLISILNIIEHLERSDLPLTDR